MNTPPTRPWAGSPYRRRRVIWLVIILFVVALLFLSKYPIPSFLSLSSSLKDYGFSPSSSRAGRVAEAKQAENAALHTAAVREVDALLHFVTAYPERRLDEDGGSIRVEGLGSVTVDSENPVDFRVYSPEGDDDWEAHLKTLNAKYPLVVFSKTYCPYSQRAKALLTTYDISPPPKIIEINTRSDGPQIQAILARLTGRTTVPNILLKGETIGGSDDIQNMHDEQRLKTLLEEGGLKVHANIVSCSLRHIL
ncbi:Glutaredoxin-C1 [Grifola frondosa]|uniref:Glutaredoxin-C1 n=1 Tax=Grifola frondosa TaxID=5627 RepID=A0A1C7M1S9_GRIFR|nr:Glutaredoxin-C1 [Grifola frondosa]